MAVTIKWVHPRHMESPEQGELSVGAVRMITLADHEAALAEKDKEIERWKKHANDMEECIDNVRESLGLKTTHYLVLADQVNDLMAQAVRFAQCLTEYESVFDCEKEAAQAFLASKEVQAYQAQQKEGE
jgi:hypothetical protein